MSKFKVKVQLLIMALVPLVVLGVVLLIISYRSIMSKAIIVDAMDSLSAISEENAASTEETSASMQELNATVNVLSQSASDLNDLAKRLESDLGFFKI